MKTVLIFAILLVLGAGIWQGVELYQTSKNGAQIDLEPMNESLLEHAVKHLDSDYVCPMHPSVVSSEPGSCPICGMDLEPRKASVANESGVVVSAAMQRNMGLVTATVGYGPVAEEIYGSGEVIGIETAHTTTLKSKVVGTVQKILVEEGSWVDKDSPVIVVKSARYTELKEAFVTSRESSQFRKMKEYISELTKIGAAGEILLRPLHTGLPSLPENLEFTASQVGKLSQLKIAVGDAIKDGTPLFEVSSPKMIRAELRTYSRRANAAKLGGRVKMEIAELPGRDVLGRVIRKYTHPSSFYSMNEVLFPLPDDIVFIGMFVGGFIEIGNTGDVLRVPSSAVIYGDRSTRVVRKHENGHFIVLDVEVGFEGTDWIEIVSGLKEGGRVVTRSQFMLDSEASMRAGFERLKEGDENL